MFWTPEIDRYHHWSCLNLNSPKPKSSSIFSITLLILAALLGGSKAYIDHRLSQELDNFKSAIASYLPMNYREVKLSLTGNLVLNGLDLKVPMLSPLHIETVTLYRAYRFYQLPQLPTAISVAMTGIHLPLSESSPPVPLLIKTLGYAPYYLTPKELRAFGYPIIQGEIFLETHFDNNQLHIKGTLTALQLGHLTLDLVLTNVPKFSPWTVRAQEIQLVKLALSYSDQGFIDKVFTWLAQRNTMALDRFKQTLTQQLQNDLSLLETSSQANLRQFIESPQILTLYWQPNSPLFINKIMDNSFTNLRLNLLPISKQSN